VLGCISNLVKCKKNPSQAHVLKKKTDRMAELTGLVGPCCKVALENKNLLSGLIPPCLHR